MRAVLLGWIGALASALDAREFDALDLDGDGCLSRAELATKEAEVDNLIAEVGANKRGKIIGRCSLSSKPKQVGGTVHPEAGVPEFVSRLLSTLDPVDALTFLRQDGLLSRAFGANRKRRRPEPEQE